MKNKSFKPRKNNFRRHNRGSKKPRKQNINYEKFINKNIKPKEVAPKFEGSFDDLNISDHLKNNLEKIGFTSPSEIQAKFIPPAIAKQDIVGLANTGTGKTGAFIIPIVEKLLKNRTKFSKLIITPTRELAMQIDAEFRKMSTGMGLCSAILVGGVDIRKQINMLRRKPHVIIATPGRLNDVINRGLLSLLEIDTLVIDEADRMFDMGFIGDIEKIVQKIPDDRQTFCLSATMTAKIKGLISKIMKNNFTTIEVSVNQNSDHIYQDVIHFNDSKHRITKLKDVIAKNSDGKILIFCDTKRTTDKLSIHLKSNDLQAVSIHGDKAQGQRQRALKQFKSDIDIMVATDVAARGLDIKNITLVINFDQPQTYDDYIHRIGRTGRGGEIGTAITFVKK